jgi:hypothetical protein
MEHRHTSVGPQPITKHNTGRRNSLPVLAKVVAANKHPIRKTTDHKISERCRYDDP